MVRSRTHKVSFLVGVALMVSSVTISPVAAHANLTSSSWSTPRALSGHVVMGSADQRVSDHHATRSPRHKVVRHTPVIIAQPRSLTVEEGGSAEFTARATETPRARVSWYVARPGSNKYVVVAGATTTTLRMVNVTAAQSGSRFEAVFTNPLGHAHSAPAHLRVVAAAAPPPSQIAPVVVQGPQSVSVLPADNVSFSAAATGTPTPSVQWEVSTNTGASFSPLAGATSNTLSLSSVTTSMNATQYEAVFTNSAGTATSAIATLSVLAVGAAPLVTTTPVATAALAGKNVSFSAAATGTPTPSVQWEVSTNAGASFSPVAGATSATLTLSNVTTSMNATQYEAVFTNSAGTATSAVATLSVVAVASNLGASSNWAGYVATSGTFSQVSATWTVPMVKCTSASTYSSVWVGIDGYQSATVEQDGTEADCSGGVASYSAWYEMYGNTNPQCNCYSSVSLPVSDVVVPGDVISASVVFASGTWNMTLRDITEGWTFTQLATGPTPTPAQSSAEWVAERPQICATSSCTSGTLATLTPQSPVTFTNVAATSSTVSGPLSNFTSVALEMVDAGTPLATPSVLDSTGSSFLISQ